MWVAMKEQTRQTKMPTAETTMGKTMASQPLETPMLLPITNAAQVDSAKEPNKSEPIPVDHNQLSKDKVSRNGE